MQKFFIRIAFISLSASREFFEYSVPEFVTMQKSARYSFAIAGSLLLFFKMPSRFQNDIYKHVLYLCDIFLATESRMKLS